MLAPLNLIPDEQSLPEGHHGTSTIAVPSMPEAFAAARDLLAFSVPMSPAIQESVILGRAGENM